MTPTLDELYEAYTAKINSELEAQNSALQWFEQDMFWSAFAEGVSPADAARMLRTDYKLLSMESLLGQA
jgi:hypothetical protein